MSDNIVVSRRPSPFACAALFPSFSLPVFIVNSLLESEHAPDPEHNRGARGGGKRLDDLHVCAQPEASGDFIVVEELSAVLVPHVQHAENVLEVAAQSRV